MLSISQLCVRGLFIILLVSIPSQVLAYIGPGTGITVIGSALALIAAILLAILGFLWYPIKRLLGVGRKNKSSNDASSGAEEENRE